MAQLTMHAVLSPLAVGKDAAKVKRAEQAQKVGENHPERSIFAVSLPGVFLV